MKTKIGTFLLIFCLGFLHGIDEVDKLIIKAEENRVKSNLKVLEYAEKAYAISKTRKYEKGIADSLYWISYANFFEKEKNEEVKKNLLTAYELYKKIKDQKGRAQSAHLIGFQYYFKTKYEKALDYLQEARKISKQIGFTHCLSNSLFQIGNIYYTTSQYDKAIKYFILTEKEASKAKDTKLFVAYANTNIGNIYLDIHKGYENALTKFQTSLKIFKDIENEVGIAVSLANIGRVYQEQQKDNTALDYFLESKRLHEKINKDLQDPSMMLDIYFDLGIIYLKKENYNKAIKNFYAAKECAKTIGNINREAKILISIGDVWEKRNLFSKAIKNYEESLSVSREFKLNETKMTVLSKLALIYERIGNIKKSLFYYKQYHTLEREIFNQKKISQMQKLQTEYETEKKEKQIESMKNEKQIQDLEMQKMKKDQELQSVKLKQQALARNAAIVISLLSVVIVVLLFRKYLYLFTFWKKKNYISHFRLKEKLGSGGMGTVFKAHDIKDKTNEIAIKVLRDDYTSNEIYKKRFKNEATIIDQIEHPNIVKVFERGEHDGNLYIAMELLDGKSLAELISGGRVDFKSALSIMVQCAEALVKIHSKNIIHRDIKPENIMIVEGEDDPYIVKVLDFGLAKAETVTKMTQTGAILGTIFYMAPEQVTQKELTPACDIFSLGAVFYEMLTGEKPFLGESAMDVAEQILDKEPVEPNKFRDDIPPMLNTLIVRMMNKDRDQRPDAVEIRNTLMSTPSF